jgi:hypothetical protein
MSLWGTRLNILITNAVLTGRTGTEIVVRDLALELKRQGHAPEVYSPALGPIADEIRKQQVSVISELRQLTLVPNIIHGQHHAQTLAALLRFPDVPAVGVCHDFTSWRDEPLVFPRVLRYVAVDYRCKRRLDENLNIPKESVRVIPNAVDLARFKPRPPLPAAPRRAAIFSNYAAQWTHAPVVLKACQDLGLEVDVIGAGFHAIAAEPEGVLPQYDLVFAKARCALEAMAVGAAVVLCDFSGLGPMVNSSNFEDLRKLNFGAGTLTRTLEPALIAMEARNYDPQDARRVSERVRQEADLRHAVADWIELYQEVCDEYAAGRADCAREYAALADYVVAWGFQAGVEWDRLRLRDALRWPKLGGWILRSLQGGMLRRFIRRV